METDNNRNGMNNNTIDITKTDNNSKYNHQTHMLYSQYTNKIQSLDIKERQTAYVTTNDDPIEELIFQDDAEDDPSEDIFYSPHHPYRKYAPIAPANNDYINLFECTTYNAIFEIKENETSLIIANPKNITTSITSIMQRLILYGNIGSADLMMTNENSKYDLHIDIFKYITDNVKSLFPVPEYFKKLINSSITNLKSNYSTPTNNIIPASNIINNQIRINELTKYITKPYFFLNTMCIPVPPIPRIDLRILRTLHERIYKKNSERLPRYSKISNIPY